MLQRGGISFLALLIINPLIVILYQNCSFVAPARSEMTAHESPVIHRNISSVPQNPVAISTSSTEELCRGGSKACLKSSIE